MQRLLGLVVDDLDLGLMVCSPGLEQVLFSNTEGAHILRALGAPRRAVPGPVREALGGAPVPVAHFTAAVEFASPAGQRFFVRARQLGRTGATLVLLTAAHVRTADLTGHLHQKLSLTCRQAQCAALVQAGLRNREIADRLGICEGRVEQHLVDVYQALGVASRTGLAVRLAGITQELETGTGGSAPRDAASQPEPRAARRRRGGGPCTVPDHPPAGDRHAAAAPAGQSSPGAVSAPRERPAPGAARAPRKRAPRGGPPSPR